MSLEQGRTSSGASNTCLSSGYFQKYRRCSYTIGHIFSGISICTTPSTPNVGLNTYVASDKQDIHLSDGSLIKLDKNSTLKEKAFRNIYLDGRAYFDIATDKSHPFSIQLQHGKITVLGTAFNINTSAKFSQIYVTEGRVKYEYKDTEYILTAGICWM
ncbi:MAG: FecR domain-containing protein [Saprospiraceae bacterium]|nr:FecR domain-containing protein [Saprospiraceae bacterium]